MGFFSSRRPDDVLPTNVSGGDKSVVRVIRSRFVSCILLIIHFEHTGNSIPKLQSMENRTRGKTLNHHLSLSRHSLHLHIPFHTPHLPTRPFLKVPARNLPFVTRRDHQQFMVVLCRMMRKLRVHAPETATSQFQLHLVNLHSTPHPVLESLRMPSRTCICVFTRDLVEMTPL